MDSEQGIEKRIQAFEMRCYRRILGITYKDWVTNQEVEGKVRKAACPLTEFLRTVKKRKLKWFGLITRSKGLAKTIMQGTVPRRRERGNPEDNEETTSGSGQEFVGTFAYVRRTTNRNGGSWFMSPMQYPNGQFG